MEQVRLVVSEAQPITRLGLRVLLEGDPSVTVVGEAGHGEEVLRLAEALAPDVLLLDVDMPGLGAPALVRRLRAGCPEVRVLALSAHDDAGPILSGLLEAGAAGYLLKQGPVEAIVAAVRRVARGEVAFSQEQLARARAWREEAGRRWGSLTERERRVLALLVQGQTNREIAQALDVAVKTVESHVSRILSKLGAASRAVAAVWAVSNGFVEQAGHGGNHVL